MFDGEKFGGQIVDFVKGYMEREFAPLKTENETLKARVGELEARPQADDILRLVQEEVAKIPPAENGKDADPEQVASLVAEEVGRAVAALPAPPSDEWGASLTEDEKIGLISLALRKELEGELIVLPDPIEPRPAANDAAQVVVHNHIPKRGREKTVITEHDERGRIASFERYEV